MTRAFRWPLIGAFLLLELAGCARIWFAEREPWRREAEISCLRSGAVKEGPSVAIIKAIDGPGVCGADYPVRVSALGDPALVSFADELVRPTGAIRVTPDYLRASPSAPPPTAPPHPAAPYAPSQTYAAGQSYAPPPTTPSGVPMSLAPADLYARQHAPIHAPVEQAPVGRQVNAAVTARPATVAPAATLACPLVSMLDRFASDSVQPAAMRWFGQPVVEIKQISAYSCRGMNGDSNARISEHAFGNALDIAAFTLAGGRVITVKDGWHGAPEEQAFLRDVHGAACRLFTTVLAPGSNAYHYDHMHVDLMRRPSGHVVCEPAAIPGEAAFAHAGGRHAHTQQAEAPDTGLSATRRYPPPAPWASAERPDARDRGRWAVAGED